MKSAASKFLASERGSILISIVIGFGLATFFRKACKGRACLIVRSPPLADLKKNVYKIDGQCYKYRPYVVPCSNPATSIKAAK
jgi:rhodanese-related sulfurtransferase